MCRFTSASELSNSDLPEYLNSLNLDEISDEEINALYDDLQAYEEVNYEALESDNSSDNNDVLALSVSDAFKPGFSVSVIEYVNEVYVDYSNVEFLHLQTKCFDMDDQGFRCEKCINLTSNTYFTGQNLCILSLRH